MQRDDGQRQVAPFIPSCASSRRAPPLSPSVERARGEALPAAETEYKSIEVIVGSALRHSSSTVRTTAS
jgi:hypothetical protein